MCVIGHRSGFIEGAACLGIPVFYLNNERENFVKKHHSEGQYLWGTIDNPTFDRLRELADVVDTFVPIEALQGGPTKTIIEEWRKPYKFSRSTTPISATSRQRYTCTCVATRVLNCRAFVNGMLASGNKSFHTSPRLARFQDGRRESHSCMMVAKSQKLAIKTAEVKSIEVIQIRLGKNGYAKVSTLQMQPTMRCFRNCPKVKGIARQVLGLISQLCMARAPGFETIFSKLPKTTPSSFSFGPRSIPALSTRFYCASIPNASPSMMLPYQFLLPLLKSHPKLQRPGRFTTGCGITTGPERDSSYRFAAPLVLAYTHPPATDAA
jgi:hypothetical protein